MSSFYGCGGGDSSGSGTAGVGISNAVINDAGELVFTFTDGTVRNLGKVLGENGATFTPSVENNILTWTNDAGLPNPDPLDFNEVLEDVNESDFWQNLDEMVDTLEWGDVDSGTAGETDIDYEWGEI